MRTRARTSRPLAAIDLFAGAGGVTAGYKRAGVRVLAAVEQDDVACDTYAANHPDVVLFERDIRGVSVREVMRKIRRKSVDIVTACSPCGSYSTLRRGRGSVPDKDLALVVIRFARVLKPRFVVLENVPQLRTDWRFKQLTTELTRLGYGFWWDVLDAKDYGVPQHRRRLIVIAMRGPAPAGPRVARYMRTVDDAISSIDRRDSLHRVPDLDETVLRRIRAIPRNGGGRSSLPRSLRLACHDRLETSAATSVYGRMRGDEPAPTLTTRCTTPACGRFIHPRRNRPITLREAACLQTFPRRYRFIGNRQAVERQIGNAVPVELARRLAVSLQLRRATATRRSRST